MEHLMQNQASQEYFGLYTAIRTDSYALLASLLSQPPSERVMQILQALNWEEAIYPELDNTLKSLCQVANTCQLDAVKEEFNRLFVGLGSGEIVPYASWYREKRIHALPLASLRSDLIELGIVRRSGQREYEDHMGVLCEIMALISQNPDEVPCTMQAKFFQKHVAPWAMSFFRDLYSAKSADFYRIVAQFGNKFFECENEYLNMAEVRRRNRG